MAVDLPSFLDHLDGVREQPSGISARCPAHDDRVASLSVSEGDAGILVHCHAGCSFDSILSALHLGRADLAAAPHVVASYSYQAEDGSPLWAVQRWAPKDFRVVPGLPPPAQRVPYALPYVRQAIAEGQTVYVVEGERDVETLRSHGLIGTCNVGGAGSWLDHYSVHLTDAHVVIVADDDEPGMAHGRAVYASVLPYAATVSLVRPLYGKDATELLAAGYPITHTQPVPDVAPLLMISADQVQRRDVAWAWDRYVPLGSVTILDGDPGDGKSTLTCDLVARWTTLAEMPDGTTHPGPFHCIMVSAEDDEAATIVPRLRAAGANLSRVKLLTDEAFTLSHVAELYAIVQTTGAKVVTIDPLMAYMPSAVNGMVDAEIRKVLRPLGVMAKQLGIAVLVVRHLTKSGTTALHAGSGSIGIIGAARSALLAKISPSNPEQRVLAVAKANLTRKPPSLLFRIDDHDGVSGISWHGEIDMRADDLFGDGTSSHDGAREQAQGWLLQLLDGKSLTWPRVMDQAKLDGFSERTLIRARQGICASVRNPSMGGIVTVGTYWHRADQWPFDSAGDAQSPSLPNGQATEPTQVPGNLAKTVTASDNGQRPDEDDLWAELNAGDHSCRICGAPEAIAFGRPWWTWRCVHHDPRNAR